MKRSVLSVLTQLFGLPLEPACGTCDACAFRLEAFRNAGSRVSDRVRGATGVLVTRQLGRVSLS